MTGSILICRFAAQGTFLIIINVGNSWAASYFCGRRDTLFFWIFFLLECSKEEHLFLKYIFLCNNVKKSLLINVMASKSIYFSTKIDVSILE